MEQRDRTSLEVFSLAAQMLQDCAELCELQVQSPFRSYQHTSTEVHHDIKQMVSHLRETKVTSEIHAGNCHQTKHLPCL